MNNITLLLRIAGFALSLIAGGCVARVPADENIDRGEVTPVVEPIIDQAGTSVAVAMSAEQFGAIAVWLGRDNVLTLEKAVNVSQDGTTLDAKAGTKLSYTMAADHGTITFEKPWPTVKTNLASRLIGGVSVREITLNADGSGFASTGIGDIKLRWYDDESSSVAAASDLPEVWCYSMEACSPCAKAKKDFETEAKSLGFKAVWKDDPPSWMPNTRPAFWWHVSAKQPTQDDVNNTRRRNGYTSLKDFIDTWKSTREPKKFTRARAGTATANPFDRDGQRAVVRYHSGHSCPECGRTQYDIESDAGPNHVHKCPKCFAAWQHTDQKRSGWW